MNSIAGGEAAEVAGEGGGEASGVGGSASVSFGVESEGPGGEGDEGEEMEKEVVDEEEEDFLFPVTPEQLIVLNLAEMAAGEEDSCMVVSAMFVSTLLFVVLRFVPAETRGSSPFH